MSAEESTSSTQTSLPVKQEVETNEDGGADTIAAPHKDFRFWMIMIALCTTGLLGALENTVVTTSLPEIVTALNVGENYVWITNVFFLTR
jgi:hypothetical protein